MLIKRSAAVDQLPAQGAGTRPLNQVVLRRSDRVPTDFMFALKREEIERILSGNKKAEVRMSRFR